MTSHFVVPTFDKSTPNKVHDNLIVDDRNTVSNPLGFGWFSAIATESFPLRVATILINGSVTRSSGNFSAIATESIPATVDGEYIFAVRVDNTGRNAFIMIGVTATETFDSSKESFPGRNGMTGCALDLRDGNYMPDDNPNLIHPRITTSAIDVIVVVTIANNGNQKLIRWIVNGTSSPNQDCTADCNGNKLFPLVTLGGRYQQLATIPIDQITIRNDETNKFIEKFSKQSSPSKNQGAVANINNPQQPSSATVAQLQQELEKEGKRADLAETQLQQEKQHSNSKDQQLQKKDQEIQDEKKVSAALTTQVKQKDQELQQKDQVIQQKDAEIERLRQLLNPSAFVKDKLYQIDFAANGITPPTDPNAFGTLLKLPSSASSPLLNEARSLFRTAGSWAHGTAQPVIGFELKEIEVINTDVASIELRIRRLQQLRSQNGNFFNPPTGAFTAEQLQTLIALRDQFLPRSSTADPKSPNLINVFHGTKVDRLPSVVNGLVAVRSTDAGFFGLGVYTTTSIEYAAKYAKGDFDAMNGPYPPRVSDGCVPVVWCVAAVGVCYPVTPQEDYKKRNDGNSDFFGVGLKPGYDCHCVGVSQSNGFQAVPRKDMQYMEVVFDQEVQVLPIAVLWVKEI